MGNARDEFSPDELKKLDLEAWEHEIAHLIVAQIIGAAFEQIHNGEGRVQGTAFQCGVVGAAGPIWDRLQNRYVRTSDQDANSIGVATDLGWPLDLLERIASIILRTDERLVKKRAAETLPAGPIADIRFDADDKAERNDG